MGLLAYQPDEVGRLHLAMRRALDELRTVTCHDPAAADAMRLVRSSAAQLETVWLPLAFRLLTTDPLSGRQRRTAGIGGLDQALIKVMADGYGWSVQTDPLSDDASAVTVEEARALGAMLNQVDPHALAEDPERLAWLAQQLAIIAADPVLSREFLANFHDWAPLCNWLGWAHLLHSGGDPAQFDPDAAERITSVVDGLAAIQWQAILASGGPDTIASADDAVPQLDGMQPYAAALLVSNMPLTGEPLVTVAIDLMQRYMDQPMTTGLDGPWGDKDFETGPKTGDLLLPLILCDRATTIAYVRAAIATDPLLLFATTTDHSLPQAAMLTAVDPRYVTGPEAAAVILPLLTGFMAGGDTTIDISRYGFDPNWHAFLGALVAPWMLELTDLRNTWGLTHEQRIALLEFIIRDDAAMAALLARSQAIVDGLLIDAEQHATTDADAVAGMLGTLLQLFVGEATRTAEIDHAQWELAWTMASTLVGTLTGGIVSGVAANLGSTFGQQVVEANGWLGAPDVGDATLTAALARQVVMATAAASVADATTQRLVDDGLLPEGIEPPPPADATATNPDADYRRAYDDWKQRNGIEPGSEAAQQLDEMVEAFVPAALVNEHAAEKLPS
ncbi:MAG: hypothetical protein ABMA25_20280 [Ilumatobacteraceae bacterium]